MLDTDARHKKLGAGKDDIDAFLAKVNQTQSLIQGMKDGKLKPEDVRIPGELTEEEKRERAERSARRAEQLRVGREREQAEAIVAEREKWWGHAELIYGDLEDRHDARDADAEEADERASRIVDAYTKRDANDYSQWADWEPKDPVTLAEQAEQAALADKVKDAEFEKMNPDFCDKFKEDIVDRQRTTEMKRSKATRLQKEGNKAFKKRRFGEALLKYQEALALENFRVALLTNIANVHLKLGALDDVTEFCNRALHVEPSCVKALSRRAAVARQRGDLDAARADLDEAVRHDGGATEDLLKEQRDVHALIAERELEMAVAQRAEAGEARQELSDLGLLKRMVERLHVDVAEQFGEAQEEEDDEEEEEEEKEEGNDEAGEAAAVAAGAGGKRVAAKKRKGKAAAEAKAAKAAQQQGADMAEALAAATAAATAAGIAPGTGKANATAALCELIRMGAEADAGRAPAFMGGAVRQAGSAQSAAELRVLLRTTGGIQLLIKRLSARPAAPAAPETAEPAEEEEVVAGGGTAGAAAALLPSLDPSPVDTLEALRLAVSGDERNLKIVCREGGMREALALLAEGGAEVHASGSVTAASVRGAALALARACAESEQGRSRLAKHGAAVLGVLECLFDWERPALVEDAACLVQKLASGEASGIEALRQAPIDVVAALAAALGASRLGVEGAAGGEGAVALMREELVGALAQLTLAEDMRARFAELALVGAADDEDDEDAEDDGAATPVVALLDVVRCGAGCVQDRARSKELALAALMNASCEPSGSVRQQIRPSPSSNASNECVTRCARS